MRAFAPMSGEQAAMCLQPSLQCHLDVAADATLAAVSRAESISITALTRHIPRGNLQLSFAAASGIPRCGSDVTRQRTAKKKNRGAQRSSNVSCQDIQALLDTAEAGRWRNSFRPEFLQVHYDLGRQRVRQARQLATGRAIARIDVVPTVLHAIFATDRPDHAFQQEPLRWGFGLTEPMATKTLARLLSAGYGEMRARRILAFMQAIGLPEGCASLQALERCRIVAEQDRIDLKLVWTDDAGQDVVVIIEAKFGHKITKGQLSDYWAAVKRTHKRPPLASILLTLDDSACKALKNKQRANWKQVDWRAFCLRFERLRPIEHDAALQMFLMTLWHRSGCLTQENKHGWI